MKHCDIRKPEMEPIYHRINEHIKELRKIYSDGKCADCENYNNCEYLPEYDENGNCLLLSEERVWEWQQDGKEITAEEAIKLGKCIEEGFRKGLRNDRK